MVVVKQQFLLDHRGDGKVHPQSRAATAVNQRTHILAQ
jgi:hypothetical protein